MIVLASSTDVLRVISHAPEVLDSALHISVSYVDYASPSTYTPGRLVNTGTYTPTTTATTHSVLTCPASTQRAVKSLVLHNNATNGAARLTVAVYDGTNAAELFAASVPPGGNLEYHEGQGFSVTCPAPGVETEYVDYFDPNDVTWLPTGEPVIVALPHPRVPVNMSSGTAATIEKIWEMSVQHPKMAVASPMTHVYFKVLFFYKVDATTTGFSGGLDLPPANLSQQYGYTWMPLSTTTATLSFGTNGVTGVTASCAATGGNVAVVEGIWLFGTTTQPIILTPGFRFEFGGSVSTRELSHAILMVQ